MCIRDSDNLVDVRGRNRLHSSELTLNEGHRKPLPSGLIDLAGLSERDLR